MKFILRTTLLLGGTILLCNCKQKSDTSSLSILANDSIDSTVTASPATGKARSIIEAWNDEPISKMQNKPHLFNRYNKSATESLRNKLWTDILIQYDRSTIIRHYRQYYYAVNSYLNEYITAHFILKLPLIP